jgi:hypothetical protein
MNGKSCIYEREIDDTICALPSNKDKRAFVIMPFGEQRDVLYQWEIAPFLRNGGEGKGEEEYQCTPERADDIRQIGYIICEKICKKIQEADYIVVDVTFDNPNVFYEFGLATALRKRIIPICANDMDPDRKESLKSRLGIPKLLPYPKFDMFNGRISEFVWTLDDTYNNFGKMAGDRIAVLYDAQHKMTSTTRYHKEECDFGALCKTAVSAAVRSIFSEENMKSKPELRLYGNKRLEEIQKPHWIDLSDEKSSYKSVIDTCQGAACVLIDVSIESAITNFFWLGYIHGIGGNAIPVNSYQLTGNVAERPSPFDIRALWHIAFREDHPVDLLTSLHQILEYIYIHKARNLNREAFWKDILEGNRVSVFLGSLYLDDLGRNTIGDWDYRTAAEIANYLSTSKETMKVTLESPLPKRASNPDDDYNNWLMNQIKDNTIIVGSADVNDLTEVALCKILGQPPFQPITSSNKNFKGYIAHKKYQKDAKTVFPETSFYLREKADQDSRGFIIQMGAALRREWMEPHTYPADQETNIVRHLLGQLVIAKNPKEKGKWIIIISGISGPATLGIAQMLTGCMYKEFTINSVQPASDIEKQQIDSAIAEHRKKIQKGLSLGPEPGKIPYDSLSEHILKQLLDVADKSGGEVNALVAVDVYYPPRSGLRYSNDERKVIGWEFLNLTEFLGMNWANPNDLKCSKSGENDGLNEN